MPASQLAGGVGLVLFGLFAVIAGLRWARFLANMYSKQGLEASETFVKLSNLVLGVSMIIAGVLTMFGC